MVVVVCGRLLSSVTLHVVYSPRGGPVEFPPVRATSCYTCVRNKSIFSDLLQLLVLRNKRRREVHVAIVKDLLWSGS